MRLNSRQGMPLLIILLLFLSSCASDYPPLPNSAWNGPYYLDSGDKVRVIVYNDQSLTQEYGIGVDGVISLPLIGRIPARNRTLAQLQQAIIDRLQKGVYTKPGVSVEITQYRPFYITGEIVKPGAYPYSRDLTVLSAVALAGGFTVRADAEDMTVDRRQNLGGTRRFAAHPASPIEPGDVIVIAEKLF